MIRHTSHAFTLWPLIHPEVDQYGADITALRAWRGPIPQEFFQRAPDVVSPEGSLALLRAMLPLYVPERPKHYVEALTAVVAAYAVMAAYLWRYLASYPSRPVRTRDDFWSFMLAVRHGSVHSEAIDWVDAEELELFAADIDAACWEKRMQGLSVEAIDILGEPTQRLLGAYVTLSDGSYTALSKVLR